MTSLISISDLNTTINHEPRILDVRLAEALGFKRPLDIRPLIERHKEALKRFGEVFRTVRKTTSKGGRPTEEIYLNKKQSTYICTKSETENATEVTIHIVEVFHSATTGQIVSVPDATGTKLHFDAFALVRTAIGLLEDSGKEEGFNAARAMVAEALNRLYTAARIQESVLSGIGSKQLPLPLKHKPIDAKEVHALCNDILVVLGHFQMMNQQGQYSRSRGKVQKLLLDAATDATNSIVKEVIFHA